MDNFGHGFPDEFIRPLGRSFAILKRSNVDFFQDKHAFGKYWRFLYILPCTTCVFASMAVYAVKMVTKGDDYIELANIFPVIFVSIQCFFKGSILVSKSNEISVILKELGALWPCDDDLRESQLSVKSRLLNRLNIFVEVYYWLNILGSWQYLLTPLAECIFLTFIMNQETNFQFPIGDSYPHDVRASWWRYLGTYFFQCYGMIKLVYFLLGAELIIIVVTAHMSTLFVLLKDDLLTSEPEGGRGLQDRCDDEIQACSERSGVRDLVRRHQKLIMLCNNFDDIFNKIIFCNLMFATITICFFGFIAKIARGPGDIVRNFVGVVASILPIFNLCYYGQLLQDASAGLADSAYSNLWYQGSTKYQKILCFIIFRSQRPCCVTSLKYAPVTLATFTTVMSTTWSYFSLMSSVYDE